MEIYERTVIIPGNQSFVIKEIDLKNNKGIIHTHDSYELNFIIDAYGRRFVSGNISRFIPGDLILMAPGVPHCWEIENKEVNPRAITAHFKKDFFEKALVNIPEFDPVNELIKKSRQGVFIRGSRMQPMHNLLSELTRKPDDLMGILQLLYNIAMIDDLQTLANSEYGSNTELPHNLRLKSIYEYIFHNFRNNLRLSDAASLIGLSEGAFCAYFKKCTKKTFTSFVKEVRIGYACKLLKEHTGMTISEICFESGYNNFSNFNRQFREITAMSPREYRDNRLRGT